MKVFNSTCYPDEEVRRLVAFGLAETNRDGILVRVSHTRVSRGRRKAGSAHGASGSAYRFVLVNPDTPPDATREIHLRIGKPGDYPANWYDLRSAVDPIGELADWREALVAIAAHEGQHITFYREGEKGRSDRAIEASCDAHAAGRLRRFRDSVL